MGLNFQMILLKLRKMQLNDNYRFILAFIVGLIIGISIGTIIETFLEIVTIRLKIFEANRLHKITGKRYYVIRTQAGIKVLLRSEISNKKNVHIDKRLLNAIYVTK